MEIATQGAFVNVYKEKRVFIRAFSIDSNGSPISGHGKLEKHPIDAPDEAIGASINKCIYNRHPGHYVPHMYKEREAYLADRKAYIEDRGIVSDQDFNRNTHSYDVYLWDDRIEFAVFQEENHSWHALVTLPLDASNVQLGQAFRQTYEYLLAQDN